MRHVSGPNPTRRVAVLYLARHAEGLDCLRRFADSYLRCPAGVEHDLVILYKGFAQASSLDSARKIFALAPHTAIELPDSGFDIGAYLAAARLVTNEYLCFVNTFAQVTAGGWLQSLLRIASAPSVGVAGAMGSYESMQSTLKLSHKIRWLCNEARLPYDERLDRYFAFVTSGACKEWRAQAARTRPSLWARMRERVKTLGWRYRSSTSLAAALRPLVPGVPLDEQFERRWSVLAGSHGIFADYTRFKPFPNPHVRTNGFILRRQRLLELGFDMPKSKMDAWEFESGARSITSRLRGEGLAAMIVDRDGRVFDVQDWSHSSTFRLGAQQGLLLTDNQTRKFAYATAPARAAETRVAWGDYAGPPPADFPDLGVPFAVDASAMLGPRALPAPSG